MNKIITHHLSAEYVDDKYIGIDIKSIDGKQYHLEYSVPNRIKYSSEIKFRRKGQKQFEKTLQKLIDDAYSLGYCNNQAIPSTLRIVAFNFKHSIGSKVNFFEMEGLEELNPEHKKLLANNPGKKLLFAKFID